MLDSQSKAKSDLLFCQHSLLEIFLLIFKDILMLTPVKDLQQRKSASKHVSDKLHFCFIAAEFCCVAWNSRDLNEKKIYVLIFQCSSSSHGRGCCINETAATGTDASSGNTFSCLSLQRNRLLYRAGPNRWNSDSKNEKMFDSASGIIFRRWNLSISDPR